MNRQNKIIRSGVFFCLILSSLFLQALSGQKLSIASCQFPVSDNIAENAQWIMQEMLEAHSLGATVCHFPECALSGYPGVDMRSMENFQWEELHSYTDSITRLAQQLEMWVLLGSIHELSDTLKPLNSLYVINSSGKIIDRYDKRFCTKGDLKYFSAGNHFVVFDLNGVSCGLLICFDVRFPELYREYKKLDVDLIFQSFYNARQKPGGIHPKIMPVTAQTRAATNHFYMSLTNSSAANSWPCHFITPDGLIEGTLPANQPGVLISELDLSDSYYDASKNFRENAMEGILYSEKAPEDPRYTNRQGR